MKTKSEGIRRLSILFGSLGALLWLIFVLFETAGFSDELMDSGDIIIIFIGTPLAFFIPLFIVRGIHWVYLGFQQDKKSNE